MTVVEPDLPALRTALRAAFPDRWAVLVATVDDRYEPEDEPRENHYAWLGSLVEAVLEPAIKDEDGPMCDRVTTFALPLHGTPVGDAVQHRLLRYSCRDEVRAQLRGLLQPELLARLAGPVAAGSYKVTSGSGRAKVVSRPDDGSLTGQPVGAGR